MIGLNKIKILIITIIKKNIILSKIFNKIRKIKRKNFIIKLRKAKREIFKIKI